MSLIRPMLSATLEEETFNKIDWKVGQLVSPKIDGIRCLMRPNLGAMSRSMKPIPNRHIRKMLEPLSSLQLDGELTAGPANTSFQTTTSAVMSEAGEPYFEYHVFDYLAPPSLSYSIRFEELKGIVEDMNDVGLKFIKLVEHRPVYSVAELLLIEEKILLEGYEGVIGRHPERPYKYNRSTLREQGMWKLKRFEDAEGVCTGWEPLYENRNEATVDERGYTKRSAHQANKVALDMVGKLHMRVLTGPFAGTEASVGSGMDDTLRTMLFKEQDTLEGRIIKFKYQRFGSKDTVRTPIFLGFRHNADMGG